MVSRVEDLERAVFKAMNNGLVDTFSQGIYFEGDRSWHKLAQDVKRPDIIFIEPGPHKSVSVRPYDIKYSLSVATNMGQISPLTLKSLMGSNEFYEKLMDTLSDEKLSDHRIIFEEGGFVISGGNTEITYDKYGFSQYRNRISVHKFGKLSARAPRLIAQIGYFPYTAHVKIGGKKYTINDVHQYGDTLDVHPYTINTNTRSQITYLHDKIRHKKTARGTYRTMDAMINAHITPIPTRVLKPFRETTRKGN